jgi:methylphosphotriester-DNA--protein-cysteine methyltransferase
MTENALFLLPALRRARDLIDRDYAEPLDQDAMAGEAGYSRFHFVRAFAVAYGETPRAYLTRRRIERAKTQWDVLLPLEAEHVRSQAAGNVSPTWYLTITSRSSGTDPVRSTASAFGELTEIAGGVVLNSMRCAPAFSGVMTSRVTAK